MSHEAFTRAAASQPVENCLSVEQLDARIAHMEETIPHDELPPVYDRFVAVRNELEAVRPPRPTPR